MTAEELDRRVRLHVYGQFVDSGAPPGARATAAALWRPVAEVEASYRRLAAAHVLVLDPGSTRIRMAMPFSAVATPFRVRAGQRSWWANCAWDALGIPAVLGTDATVETSCGDCGRALTVAVRDGAPVGDAVLHFAVPAAHFWDDIVFT